MITENEKKALQMAKKVFEHFTHDALPIAREIIAMELELEQSPMNGEPPDGVPISIPEVKKTDGQPINELLNDFPVSDLSITDLGVNNDSNQPVKDLCEELVYQQQEGFTLELSVKANGANHITKVKKFERFGGNQMNGNRNGI